jgi:hypothetical protein
LLKWLSGTITRAACDGPDFGGGQIIRAVLFRPRK